MHDFCFTPLYSASVLLGGLLGWATKGSVASLVAGGLAAIITAACSYVSMNTYLEQNKKCLPAVLISLGVACGVGFKMGKPFLSDPLEHIPQGLLFVVSVIMVLYYVWNLTCFTPKPAKKAEPLDINKLQEDAAKYKASKAS